MKKKLKFHIQDIGLYVAEIALFLMTMIVALNALSRYFLNKPLMQADEIATSLFVWLVFMGASACYRENGHIGIDCFVNFLPLKIRRAVEILVDIFLLMINIYMTYLSWNLTVSARDKLTSSLRMPYSVIDVSAFIGFLLMSIYSASFIYRHVREFHKPEKREEEEA